MVRAGFEAIERESAVVELDGSQRAVLELDPTASAVVLGAPGSGKTTTLVELVDERIRSGRLRADEVLVLAPSRAAATALRDRLAARVRAVTTGPLARTPESIAFEIVRRAALRAGQPAPELLTGGDQDAIVRALLEGHIDDGRGPRWPDELSPDVRRLRTFRTELRELLARATERDVSPSDLARLGARLGRPEWAAAGEFFAEYAAVVSSYRAHQLDSAELIAFARAAIERGGDESVDRLRLVAIDDAHELTEAALGLLRALAGRGIPIAAFGDPDVAANSFRGGEPDALGRLGSVLRIERIETIVLERAHRHGPAIRALVSAVTERIGSAAAGRQRSAPAGAVDASRPVVVVEGPTAARHIAGIARELRETHVREGVPWGRMAVVVRSGGQLRSVASALAAADVPTRSARAETAVRDHGAARALLRIVDVGIGRSPLDEQAALELLASPFGGVDRLGLRTLRLALRADDVANGGTRSGAELLVDALGAPGGFAGIRHPSARSASRLARTIAGVRDRAAGGASIEDLLWFAWESSGLARRWSDEASGSGVTSVEANRSLDAIGALFAVAKRFDERRPDGSPAEFVDAVLDAEVAEDVLAPSSSDDAVIVATPAAVAGREFDVVAIAHAQEGVWPNLRPRGSLLGADRLAHAIAGIDAATLDARRLVLDDELRLFALTVSRASRRVVLGAVVNDDESRSILFSLVPEGADAVDASRLGALSLRPLVGRLRREAARPGPHGEGSRRALAAAALAKLAAAGVPGADPAHWRGLAEPTTTEPLFDLADPDVAVPVSPSSLEKVERQPLEWFIDAVSGDSASAAMSLGRLLHWAMEVTALEPVEQLSADALWARVAERWSELRFESEWLGERERRLARTMVSAIADYVRDAAAAGREVVAAETSFQLAVDRAVVRGKVDRVERLADGRMVIVDLKTGSFSLRKADVETHAQLGAYQLALTERAIAEVDEHAESAGAALLFVKSGVGGRAYRLEEQAPFDRDDVEAFRERVRQASTRIAASSFEGHVELDEFVPQSDRLRWHVVGTVCGD